MNMMIAVVKLQNGLINMLLMDMDILLISLRRTLHII